jgi:hypothetical protein
MSAGLRVSYLWHDNDVLEVRIAAENSEFRGSAAVYVGTGELIAAATKLQGFPRDPSDKRDVTFGAFGSQSAGGGASLTFYCRDMAGHATCAVVIESGYTNPRTIANATLCVDFDPACLDDFLAQLRRIENQHGGSAFMAMRP